MPTKLLKKITRYRHMGITIYDPTAASESAVAALADQYAHRASPIHHVTNA
jgi:hypothetical protein